jgi:hypothetical protein
MRFAREASASQEGELSRLANQGDNFESDVGQPMAAPDLQVRH